MIIQKKRVDGVVQHYHVRNKSNMPFKPLGRLIKPLNVISTKYSIAHGVKQKIKMIPISDIQILEEERYKLRSKIDKIKLSGDIHTPIKVHAKYGPNQKYQLWDGHHRLIAARERGDKYIPAIIDLNVSAHKHWRNTHG